MSSEPTVLTEAEKQRDAARVPLASGIVDAYPNWNGIFSDFVAQFSPDGKQVLYGSLRDGAPELYLGDVSRPSDAPKTLTQGPQRAFNAHFTRDGKSVVFLRDQNGDEDYAIWRVGVDGTGLTNLTPGETMHRGEVFLPRGNPKMMIYRATKKTEAGTTLFSQAIDAGAPPKAFYKSPRSGNNFDVTADGARMLFNPWTSESDSTLEEIEVATGKARHIYPPEGKKVSIPQAAYSADGKRIFVSTDEGSETSVILALDAASGKELARYTCESPKGAHMQLAVAPKGGVVAVGVDAGNHGEVRLLDARTLALKSTVKVPLGDVQLGGFRDDGRAFAILMSQPDLPADVFSVDVKSGEVRPLRTDERAGLEGLPPITSSIATAAAFDGLHIPINVYLPKNAPGKLPTIVAFHGGPAWSFAVRWSPFNRFLLALGYAVIEPNVRGSTGFGRTYEMGDNREKRADWLKDVETVNTWAKAQSWCDPQRVIVWGSSYGGYTTLMAITRQPSLWRAGVDMYGIADLVSFAKRTSGPIREMSNNEFGDLTTQQALLEEFSPMRDVSKITAPLFVYAGQNDPRVPRSESDTIVRALRERQIPVEYIVAAGEGHSVDRRDTKIEFLTRVARFLEDHAGAKQ